MARQGVPQPNHFIFFACCCHLFAYWEVRGRSGKVCALAVISHYKMGLILLTKTKLAPERNFKTGGTREKLHSKRAISRNEEIVTKLASFPSAWFPYLHASSLPILHATIHEDWMRKSEWRRDRRADWQKPKIWKPAHLRDSFCGGGGGGACRLKRERKKERNNNRVRTAHLYLFPIASATNRKTSDGELAPVSGRNEERRHQ